MYEQINTFSLTPQTTALVVFKQKLGMEALDTTKCRGCSISSSSSSSSGSGSSSCSHSSGSSSGGGGGSSRSSGSSSSSSSTTSTKCPSVSCSFVIFIAIYSTAFVTISNLHLMGPFSEQDRNCSSL